MEQLLRATALLQAPSDQLRREIMQLGIAGQKAEEAVEPLARLGCEDGPIAISEVPARRVPVDAGGEIYGARLVIPFDLGEQLDGVARAPLKAFQHDPEAGLHRLARLKCGKPADHMLTKQQNLLLVGHGEVQDLPGLPHRAIVDG